MFLLTMVRNTTDIFPIRPVRFAVGHVSEQQKEIYELVREAQETGVRNMGPGIVASKPDTEIRKVVKKYEEYYYSGMGHGVGWTFMKSRSLECMVRK